MPVWPPLPALDWPLIGTWVAAILTLVTLSAAFGENKASQAMFALLVGLAVGYAAAITCRAVLWPRVLLLVQDPRGHWPLVIWFALGVLLLARGLPFASWLSNLSLAYLMGVGAALAIGGAILGTALPQLVAAMNEPAQIPRGSWPAIGDALLVAIGTGAVLFRFAYTGHNPAGRSGLPRIWAGVVRSWGRLGNLFMIVALGALFATAVISLLGVLAARLQFLMADWLHLV